MEKEKALEYLNSHSYRRSIHGVNCVVKPSPYVEESYPDPSFVKSVTKLPQFAKSLPNSLTDFVISDALIRALKVPFDQVKSSLVVEDVQVLDTFIPLKEKKLGARFYYPIDALNNAPCLLYFHGGGFFGGSIDVVDAFARDICRKSGVVVCSVNYSLAPQYPFPKAHNDCFKSALWIMEHAEALGIDNKEIFIGGDSAGGALAHYATERLMEDGKKVKGMILLYPVLNIAEVSDRDTKFDLEKFDIHESQKALVEPILQVIGGPGRINAAMRHALRMDRSTSKMSYATPYLANLRKFPPTLLIQGEYDFFTLDSLAYAKKVQRRRDDLRFVMYRGMGHAFIETIGKNVQAEDAVIEIADFIKKYSI